MSNTRKAKSFELKRGKGYGKIVDAKYNLFGKRRRVVPSVRLKNKEYAQKSGTDIANSATGPHG